MSTEVYKTSLCFARQGGPDLASGSTTALQAHHAFALVRRRAAPAGTDGDGGLIPQSSLLLQDLPNEVPS